MAHLFLEIQNTGSPKYRVEYRKKGTNDPWIGGVEIDATPAPAEFTEYTFMDVDSATYEARAVAICSDDSEAPPSAAFYSADCAMPLGLNVYQDGSNFVVQYSLPVNIGKFRLRIEYPNGGILQNDYNISQLQQILIPVPPSNFGSYLFSIASICNPEDGWMSPFLSEVEVIVTNPSTCAPPSIEDVQVIDEQSLQQTYRMTLGGYTSTVKVYINNTTTNTNNTLTQVVSSGVVDIPLPRSSVAYQYQITVYNICATNTDNVGITTSHTVPANV